MEFMAVPLTDSGHEREMLVKDGQTATVLRGEYKTYRNFVRFRFNTCGVQGVAYRIYQRPIKGWTWGLLVESVVPR